MGSEKITAWWNQEVKEAILAKKTAFRSWLTNKSSQQFQLPYSAARKTATTIFKKSKENLWEEFGQKLDTHYRLENKVFWQTIRCLRGKQTSVVTFFKDTNGVLLKLQNGILNCWRQ